MIHIGVYGTEADLNRELSRRGLFRISSVHTVLYDRNIRTSNCLVIGHYGTPAHTKCKNWFREGRGRDTTPGRLEMLSVWYEEDKPLWGPRRVEKAI